MHAEGLGCRGLKLRNRAGRNQQVLAAVEWALDEAGQWAVDDAADAQRHRGRSVHGEGCVVAQPELLGQRGRRPRSVRRWTRYGKRAEHRAEASVVGLEQQRVGCRGVGRVARDRRVQRGHGGGEGERVTGRRVEARVRAGPIGPGLVVHQRVQRPELTDRLLPQRGGVARADRRAADDERGAERTAEHDEQRFARPAARVAEPDASDQRVAQRDHDQRDDDDQGNDDHGGTSPSRRGAARPPGESGSRPWPARSSRRAPRAEVAPPSRQSRLAAWGTRVDSRAPRA